MIISHPKHVAGQLGRRSAAQDCARSRPFTVTRLGQRSLRAQWSRRSPALECSSLVGKSGPSANGVLAVLLSDGVHLEIQFSQKRQLLVEKVILPGPWS